MTAKVLSGRAAEVAERLDGVRQRLAAVGVDPDRVRIVGVTKGFGAEQVAAALAAGLADLGENYADELVSKADAYPAARWHFLGALQRNKAARLAPRVGVWEAMDRPAALEAVASRAPGATVLLQVNATGDPAKHGCRPSEVAGLVEDGRGLGLDVAGLMAVGPAGDRTGAQACFATVAGLGRALGLRELSMGMSDDYDLAAGEGATTIRLGRALFGFRPTRPRAQH